MDNSNQEIVELICDICGSAMDFTGEVIHEFPHDLYMHRCPQCNHLQTAYTPYPKMQNVEAL